MYTEELRDYDIGECLDIYNYYVMNSCFSLDEEKTDIDSYRQMCKRVRKNYTFTVAKDDEGKVMGFAYLDSFNPKSGYKCSADLTIYIKNEARHEGIGSVLLESIIKWAKNNSIRNIISIITSANENSVRFHEKKGFKLEGTLHDVAIKNGKSWNVSFFRLPV